MKLTVIEAKEQLDFKLPEFPFFTKEKHVISAFTAEKTGVRIYGNNSISGEAYISFLEFEYDIRTKTLKPEFEFITVDEFNAALLAAFDNIKNKVNA